MMITDRAKNRLKERSTYVYVCVYVAIVSVSGGSQKK